MKAADITRPPAELVRRLGSLATSTLANALDEVGLTANVMPAIKAVAPGLHCAGPALTVHEVTGPHGTYASADFAVGTVIDAAQAGDVVVIAAGGAPVSTWGGMASLAGALKGLAGICVDGGVRDLEEIIESALPVFARHMIPTTGRTRLKVEAINAPVVVDGVAVGPGDIIVADGSGVLSVPAARAEEVAALAEGYAADDAAAEAALREGQTFSEVMARFAKI